MRAPCLSASPPEAAVLAVGYVLNGVSNFTFYNPDTMKTMVQIGEPGGWWLFMRCCLILANNHRR